MLALTRALCPAAVALLALGVVCPPAAAQPADNISVLAPGTRVRVTTVESRPWVGAVVALTPSTIVARSTRGDTAAVPLSSLHRLEVSRGLRRQYWRGAGIGALAGAVAGAVLAAADNGCNDDSCVELAGSSGDMAPVAIAGLGVGGAVIGGIIGSFWKREAWRALPRARWYIGTGGHGAGTLGVNLSM